MSFTGIEAVDTSLQKTNEWLFEINEELALKSRDLSWFVLHNVLHVLRDRLPAREALQLGAQLPLVVRGAFFEGWTAPEKPSKAHTAEEFLKPLQERFRIKEKVDAESATRAIFSLLARHVSQGEIEDVKACLPRELRELWPQAAKL